MRFIACFLLLAFSTCADTLWTLAGAGSDWEGVHNPVFSLVVPVGAEGEATNVTSWSTHCDCFDYAEFGDIDDYLAIVWPIGLGIEVGPASPHGPPEILYAEDTNAIQPSGIWFQLLEMSGLDTNEMTATYEFTYDAGDAPYGPLGPFTVTDPPFPSTVPEPATWMFAMIGILALVVLRRRRA